MLLCSCIIFNTHVRLPFRIQRQQRVERMTRFIVIVSLVALGMTNATFAADVAAGKAVADRQCLECHEASDWEGEDAASLASLIRDIVAGKVKHKRPLQLSDTDIQNIAAYWARGDKK